MGPVTAFEPKRQRVTSLRDWPAGRKPVEVLVQGQFAKAMIRRSWKNTHNDGTYMDFYPGWKNTGWGKDRVRVKLDDGSIVDLVYRVRDPIPSPTASGAVRYLDASRSSKGDGSAGKPWNSWNTAVAGAQAGDVVVVSAKAGTRTVNGVTIPNYVYSVDGDSGGPSSSADNVTIVADPADTLAGRRPAIQSNGHLFAPFLGGSKPNGQWVLHKDLGSHGSVWRSVRRFPAPAHSYSAMYRTKNGRWLKLYSLRNIDGANRHQPRLSQLTDTVYPRFSGTNFGTYWGPSISYETDGYYYIRLTPPAKRTIFDPDKTAGLSYPAWDWTDNYAPNMDPNYVDIVLVTGENWSNKNYLLNIDGRKGWTFKNIDFISGNVGIWAPNDSDAFKFYGVTFKGGTTMDHLDTEWSAPYIWSYIFTDTLNGVLPQRTIGYLFDHCEFWGGMPPWQSWREGKGAFGAAPFAYRGDLIGPTSLNAVFQHSILDGWWSAAWLAGPPLWGGRYKKVHIHHSIARHFGANGAFSGNTSGEWAFNRNLLIDFIPYGFSASKIQTGDRAQIGLNLMIAVTTHIGDNGGIPLQSKYVDMSSNYNHVAPVLPTGGRSVLHGSPYHVPTEWLYNNTGIGTNHAHRTNAMGGGGSQIGPTSFVRAGGHGHRVFNSVSVIVPGPWAWPAGAHTVANRYFTQAGIDNQYDYNIIWRTPAVFPIGGALGSSECNGLVLLQIDKEGNYKCYADSNVGWNQFKNETGYEKNGLRMDPQFVTDPAWAVTSPYRIGGAYDIENYMLGSSSPARTGGKELSSFNYVDYDGNTQTTWRNRNGFRGALDPNIPLLEQEIGPLGPLPSEG
jgi:major membrane immunogen (membrane-anchored lipoprotein)